MAERYTIIRLIARDMTEIELHQESQTLIQIVHQHQKFGIRESRLKDPLLEQRVSEVAKTVIGDPGKIAVTKLVDIAVPKKPTLE